MYLFPMPSRLHQLLRGSSAAVAATAVATLLATVPAHAVVVTYSGPAIPVPNNIDGVYLNVVTGVSGASSAAAPGWDVNIYNNTSGIAFFTRTADAASAYVGAASVGSALLVGTAVGPASSFTVNALTGGVDGTAFRTAGDRYFGFRFTSEATNTVHYGYGLLRSGDTLGFPASILTYSFESTPNTAITVVPEPGTYALLLAGLGIVGTIAARRRAVAKAG